MRKYLVFAAAAAASLLMSAAPASAASIIDLKTVTLTNDGSTGFGTNELASLRAAAGSATGVLTQVDILPNAFGGSIANWTAELFTGTLNVATGGYYTFDFVPTARPIAGYIKIDGATIASASVTGSGTSGGSSGSNLTAGAHSFEAFIVKKGGSAARFTGYASGTNANTLTFSPLSSAVPEPATWAMLILGFGLVGAATRARRRTVAAALA